MSWEVDEIVCITERTQGYGFSIVNQHHLPLLTLTYPTAEEAEAAHVLVDAALTGVIDVISHPDPNR